MHWTPRMPRGLCTATSSLRTFSGSAREFVETRILGCFLKNDEFGLGDRHALSLEQQVAPVARNCRKSLNAEITPQPASQTCDFSTTIHSADRTMRMFSMSEAMLPTRSRDADSLDSTTGSRPRPTPMNPSLPSA